MIDAIVGQSTLQGLGDVFLADDLGEGVGTVAPVERERSAPGAFAPGSSNSASSWVCSMWSWSDPGSSSRRSSSPASSTHAPYARMVTTRSWFYSIHERTRIAPLAVLRRREQTRFIVCERRRSRRVHRRDPRRDVRAADLQRSRRNGSRKQS